MKKMARKEVLIKDETHEEWLLRNTFRVHPVEEPPTDYAGRPDVTPGVFSAIVKDKGAIASEASPQAIRDVLAQSRGRR